MKGYLLQYEVYNPNPNLGSNVINLLNGKIYNNPDTFLENVYDYINNHKFNEYVINYDKPTTDTLKNMKTSDKIPISSYSSRISWEIYIVCLELVID